MNEWRKLGSERQAGREKSGETNKEDEEKEESR